MLSMTSATSMSLQIPRPLYHRHGNLTISLLLIISVVWKHRDHGMVGRLVAKWRICFLLWVPGSRPCRNRLANGELETHKLQISIILMPSRLETLDYDKGPEFGTTCSTALAIALGGRGGASWLSDCARLRAYTQAPESSWPPQAQGAAGGAIQEHTPRQAKMSSLNRVNSVRKKVPVVLTLWKTPKPNFIHDFPYTVYWNDVAKR